MFKLYFILLAFLAGNIHLTVQEGSFIKAKVNGKDWSATKITPDKYVSEILQVMGETENTELAFQLNKPAQGKTDNLIATDMNHYRDAQFNMYMVKSGKTVITKMNDKWVEGTFSFSAYDSRSKKNAEVANGVFRVPNPKSFSK